MVLPLHRSRLPDPAGHFQDMPRTDQEFFKELIGALQREIDLRVPSGTATGEILLASPNGSVYAVTIDNAGVIQRTPRIIMP